MIVTKETKQVYSFFEKVFGIINKGSSSAILYLDDKGVIIYCTDGIAGTAKITKSGDEVITKELQRNCFYEIAKLPHDRIKIKAIEKEKVEDISMQNLEALKKIVRSAQVHICDLVSEEHQLASKLTRLSNRYLSDRYISMMKKFGACEAYTNSKCIVLAKCSFDEDSQVELEEEMYFYSETFGSVDETVQGKLRFDQEVRLGGA